MPVKPRIVTLTLNPALDVATSVERVQPVHKLRCAEPRFDPGGGGINVARVVRRLGGDVLAVFPAAGATGARLAALVEAEGVPAAPSPAAGETRESFNVIDRTDGAEYRFVLPGPALAPAELEACVSAALAASSRGGVLVVSGSLPAGVPPSLIADLAGRARAAGLRLAVDTSGPALASALQAGVFLVKPNLKELSDHLGRALPDTAARLQASRDLIAAGAAEVIALTLSAEGALLVTRDSAWSVPAAPVQPVSTVGAGDSFLAGLIFGLAHGRPPQEALRTAAAAGAAALLAPGTALGEAENVFSLTEQIRPAAVP